MKNFKILVIFLFMTVIGNFINAQITQLIPSWRPIPDSPSSKAPNYGALLETIAGEVQRWASINCMQSINSQLDRKIASARSEVSGKTTYVVVVDYTNISACEVTSFYPHHGNSTPSVIHPPEKKLLIYTIEIHPYLLVNGKYY